MSCACRHVLHDQNDMSLSLEHCLKKKRLSRLPAMHISTKEKGESPNSGQLFNTTTTDKVRSEKWPAASLYIDELLDNSEIKSEDQSSYLERCSPKGSCHLDESSMSHALAQNCHCEFCCGVHLTCKNNPVTPHRSRRLFGVEWKENSFVAILKNGIKSIEARKNSEI